MPKPGLVAAASRNNAEWCDAFCRSHGIVATFASERWFSAVRTPPYYPDVVTLVPGLGAEAVLAGVDAGPGCSVKDSFGDVDLAPAGFEVLFPAEWLVFGSTGAARPPQPRRWLRVTNDDDLAEWEAAWGDAPDRPGFFPKVLLSDDRLAFLAGLADRRVVAGATANHSVDVIGVGNVFDAQGDLESAWAAAAAAVTELWGDLPVVGYDHGDALSAAQRASFETVGALRVWIRR
jgi:hypothetical protein